MTDSVKKPEDHKKKNFSFEHEGKTYVFEKRLTSKVLRVNRNLAELDFIYTIFEEVAGEEALAVLDDMDAVDAMKVFQALTGGNNAGE